MKSTAHCGKCDKDCRSGGAPGDGKFTCVNSICELDCAEGARKCGAAGAEKCERQDAKQCGPSCMGCPTGPHSTPTCTPNASDEYACGFSCDFSPSATTYVQCPGALGCFDLDTDEMHCGACNEQCIQIAGNLVPCACNFGKCGNGCQP